MKKYLTIGCVLSNVACVVGGILALLGHPEGLLIAIAGVCGAFTFESALHEE